MIFTLQSTYPARLGKEVGSRGECIDPPGKVNRTDCMAELWMPGIARKRDQVG